MSDIISRVKFVIKNVASFLREIFLFFSKSANKGGWGNRILIINLEAMGDLVMFTSVLKHYKKSFPDKSIYLLVKSGMGMENFLKRAFAHEVISVDYKRFAGDPFYGAGFIKRLKRIGFQTVINHDFSAAEIIGKTIAVSLNAENVIGYEGQNIEYRDPYDIQQKKNLNTVIKKILPRFTQVIKRLSEDIERFGYSPNEIEHYVTIYESITGDKEKDYSTTVSLSEESKFSANELLKHYGLEPGHYAVLNINASDHCKRWPLRKFSEVAEFLDGNGLKIVIVGSSRELSLGKEFENMSSPPLVNMIGKTSFDELGWIIKNSLLVLSNDTSTVHLAIALKKPSICIVGGGQFGVATDYGYSDINFWVWKRTACYFDNWHCRHGLPENEPSPCVEAVTCEMVLEKLTTLINYLEKTVNYPKELFRRRFEVPSSKVLIRGERDKLKIVYTGIRYENYNPNRKLSFEYTNFYLSLKNMPGIEVVEYPYDRILEIGRKKFNQELLELVRREKPDLFFAFMFTDELEYRTLDNIKSLTKSIAWFADDYWRFFNYSRHWPAHFTRIATTYSGAVDWYRKYGHENVILSQWACNTSVYKPVKIEKDIDVSFVGQRKSGRVKIIKALQNAGVDVRYFGFGWPNGKISNEEMLKIFSRSKICLNLTDRKSLFDPSVIARLFLRKSINRIVPDFHIADNLRAYLHFPVRHTHARPFELAGCGAFVISGNSEDIGKYYKEGKEMIFYNDYRDIVEKVKYFLSNDVEREAIAGAGYERTLAEHTYNKRFAELFRKAGLNI